MMDGDMMPTGINGQELPQYVWNRHEPAPGEHNGSLDRIRMEEVWGEIGVGIKELK